MQKLKIQTHFGSVPTIFSASGSRIVFGLFSSAICLSTPFSECVFIFARRHPNLYANAIAQSKTIACVTNLRDTSTTGEEDASLFVLFMMMMMIKCDLLLRRRSIYNRFRFVNLRVERYKKSSSNHRILPNDTNINNTVASSFLSFSRSYVSQRESVCIYALGSTTKYIMICND